MQPVLVSLALSGFGRDALKVAGGVALTTLLVTLFVVVSLVSLIELTVASLVGQVPTLRASGMRAATVTGLETGVPLTRDSSEATAVPAIAAARSQLGRRYVWGGASLAAGFDCSGLVQWAYAQGGARLPRTAQQQYDATRRLRPQELQPGDLVFFAGTGATADPREWISHVGMYVGHGLMTSAESGGVLEAPVFSGYWASHYAGAGRVAGITVGLSPNPATSKAASAGS
jgi:cell wall-associated NlpC family hydrolase